MKPKPLWITLYALVVVSYLFSVARFWDGETRFTELIMFGEVHEQRSLSEIKETPRDLYPDSTGYDAQFYAQIAVDPTLRNPELPQAVDNLPYRARRIGMPLVSWIFGFGDPGRALTILALINPLAWIGSALLLLKWLPPANFQNFVRWAGFLLGLGMVVSTRYALPDGPVAFLIILAVYLHQREKPLASALAVSLACLTKETSLLASALFAPSKDELAAKWKRIALQCAIIVVPIALWVLYIHFTLSAENGNLSGSRNFAYPFQGYFAKWVEIIDYAQNGKSWKTAAIAVSAHIAMSLYILFLLFKPQPKDPWWRIGIGFAILGVFLGPAVWETYPGATCRVLLCIHLAFNMLVPRKKVWLAILLVANLAAINFPRTMRLQSEIPQKVSSIETSQSETAIAYQME